MMKALSLALFFFTATCLSVKKKDPAATEIPVKGYSLFWSDEFNSRSLDLKKWGYRGTGRRDDARISEKMIRVTGSGCMIIEAKLEGDSVLTGMIATENTLRTRYGYFECRASLPEIAGIFPAFWLQSPSISVDNGRPETEGAEIDIFEYFPHARKNFVAHTLHWGGYGAFHKVAGPVWGALQQTADGFHVFGFEWTPDRYTTFVDGIVTYSGSANISHVPEFIVLSLGVNKETAGPLNVRDLPGQFMVDYVRVYKKNK